MDTLGMLATHVHLLGSSTSLVTFPSLLTATLCCSIFLVVTDCSAFIAGFLRTNSIFKEQKVKSVSSSLLYYPRQSLVEGSPLIP